jgi:hypothetical protein
LLVILILIFNSHASKVKQGKILTVPIGASSGFTVPLRSEEEISYPSYAIPLVKAPPARLTNVGRRSRPLATTGFIVPLTILPGHHAIAGTCNPPSHLMINDNKRR